MCAACVVANVFVAVFLLRRACGPPHDFLQEEVEEVSKDFSNLQTAT
jgi:hypothetical protein